MFLTIQTHQVRPNFTYLFIFHFVDTQNEEENEHTELGPSPVTRRRITKQLIESILNNGGTLTQIPAHLKLSPLFHLLKVNNF